MAKRESLNDLLDPKASSPVPNKNMGRLQKAAPHWHDHGSSSDKDTSNYLRGPEQADREEREAYGRDLPAAYRYLLGPTPRCLPGDRETARSYLRRIEQAVEQGGWTRSEWRRLRNLRAKWKARAEGRDARFSEVGNRTGGLTQFETANVKQRRIVATMQKELEDAGRRQGD